MAAAKKETEQTSTEVVTTKAGPLAAPEYLLGEDYGAGFEGADQSAFATPFLQILQKMSPLVDEDNPKHIAGAKAGMFYNTVTQQLYDGKDGLRLIPCAYKRSFVCWGGREADGGFKGEFTPEQIDAMVQDGSIKVVDGRMFKPEADGTVNEKKSDYYADTRSHYVIIIDPITGDTSRAILALASTQVKASRGLMTALQQRKVTGEVKGQTVKRTPPSFANIVKATTIGVSNDRGSWSAIKFELEPELIRDPLLFADGKEFHSQVVSGEVKADYSKADQTGTDQAVDGEQKQAEGF